VIAGRLEEFGETTGAAAGRSAEEPPKSEVKSPLFVLAAEEGFLEVLSSDLDEDEKKGTLTTPPADPPAPRRSQHDCN
jgi:hypothetical protein